MTYTIHLITGDDGATVIHTAGEVPPGRHEITGHDDGRNVNVSVIRRDPRGRQVISAQHWTDREDAP